MPRTRKGQDIHGVLLLNKGFDISSNKALQRAKFILNANKAGHTGSLDPYATGLLPLCFGEATKISQYLLGQDKTYRVEIHLGINTDSGDAQGEVVQQRHVSALTIDDIELALEKFRGEIEQVPPMFSALKKDGQPLYKLARQGIEVERKARTVKTYDIRIVNWQLPLLTLEVSCSSGFYIRSLAIDLGELLDCGGYVSALRRTSVSTFSIVDAVTLDQLEAMNGEQRSACLIAADCAVDFPIISLNAEQAIALRHGKQLTLDLPDVQNKYAQLEKSQRLYRVYHDDKFLGLGECTVDGYFKANRLFNL